MNITPPALNGWYSIWKPFGGKTFFFFDLGLGG
jgi:hypothetical protein